MSKSTNTDGFGAFDQAIIEDDGERSIQQEATRFDADDAIRLTESEAEAILEYDRAVTVSWMGRKIVVEVTPDTPRNAPIEIRKTETESEQESEQ